ncbi:hypothetical protein O1611_g5104 [Lasiodiplodia mahajangana]|uniref:Uncharacterized protein n=1 Tax=Lasiodiplodia mahajangana TaxID=1108764 RepID=A0ACC2JMG1_9PEZI|nr:hypothetical protein O1611_g5104 [Lasiodiplodia mahajangana]
MFNIHTQSFGAIGSQNVVAANHFHGTANITFNDSQDRRGAQSSTVCSWIPLPRNETFVETGNFCELLQPRHNCKTAGLYGPPGSGKSQIALEYAYRRRHDPTCSVFWVNADTETSFKESYRSIARALGLSTIPKDDALLQTTIYRCSDSKKDGSMWFGFAESSLHVLPLERFVPKGPAGTVLWTSRDFHIVGTLVTSEHAFHVGKMTFQEAKALLVTMGNKGIEEDEHDDAKQLLDELERHPVAISHAAAYMRRTPTSIKKYLEEIQDRKRGWRQILVRYDNEQRKLDEQKRRERDERERQGVYIDRHQQEHYDQEPPMHYHRKQHEQSSPILETWEISVQYLGEKDGLIFHVLNSLTFVDSQNISFDMIREAVRLGKKKDMPKSWSEDDDVTTNKIIGDLVEYSLLSVRTSDQNGGMERVYDMHGVVQKAAHYCLHTRVGLYEAGGGGDSAKTAFEIASKLFPPERLKGSWDPQEEAIRLKCQQYLKHAEVAAFWISNWYMVTGVGIRVQASFMSALAAYVDPWGREAEAQWIIDMETNKPNGVAKRYLMGLANKIRSSRKMCEESRKSASTAVS